MSERDFIDSLKMVEIESNEQLGSLLDSLKDIYSSEEIEQRLAALTFSIWSDYIKAYEYQLRVEDLQKEVDSLQAKLDKYIEIAGKLTMQVREQNSQLEEYKIDLIVLAGFLVILSEDFVRKYDKKIINIHPSLIPSFCGDGFYGLKVHEAALKRGVKLTGATTHFVNEITDGGEIIMQKAVEIKDGDTPEILQKRVMEEAEWKILPLSVEKISEQMKGKSL